MVKAGFQMEINTNPNHVRCTGHLTRGLGNILKEQSLSSVTGVLCCRCYAVVSCCAVISVMVAGVTAAILYSLCSALLFRAKYNRIFRDLVVLGYLSQLMLPVPESLSPLHSLTPYQVIGAGGQNYLILIRFLRLPSPGLLLFNSLLA